MRSIEDHKGYSDNNGTTQETSNVGKYQKRPSHHRTALGKPTPSKWDDAQKWLVNLSRGDKIPAKVSPRNSSADDRRLIMPVPKNDEEDDERENGCESENGCEVSNGANQFDLVETKNVECDESIWRSNNKPVRPICLRDMGTDMTPIASQEPSRAATPVRARSPTRSPMSSRESISPNGSMDLKTGRESETGRVCGDGEESSGVKTVETKNDDDQCRKMNPMEARAAAWDEAERAKYMARHKREEVKIQAWENHQIRKAEVENRNVQAKAERLKSRAQEKYNNKIAATRRIAEEKRANAEAKLNEMAMRTSERADYIRRSGHLPSSFSFKWPSFCW